MREQLLKVKTQAGEALAAVLNSQDLEAVRIKYLGKKGELTALLKQMGTLSAEERPAMGQLANEVRTQIESMLSQRLKALKESDTAAKLEKERLDVTVPGKKHSLGSKHPLTIVLEEVEEIFMGLGFSIAEGPEVELDYYNFEALNIPKNHPARDTQDTFYISENTLL
ncbi:MAG TPA: phenylalanine--tRNA ligase subunit alpha, partial [Oscillospiraceae bacterium]|nr:phenylalanine--tRNA ligase subunit alpha [Oscillospiraceae bacterium]